MLCRLTPLSLKVQSLGVPAVLPASCLRCSSAYTYRNKRIRITHQSDVQPRPALRQHFSTTPLRSQQEEPQNYYEILRIPPTATKADLKKQFYVLSKETHPDANPSDPTASERFSKVSEAYSILSNEDKRRRYDRDVLGPMQRRAQQRSGSGEGRAGTYAGSRPATGLSKRRGTFRGPPPSFYAHGGASASAAGSTSSAGSAEYQAGTFNASNYTEPGHWDPTFNPTPVYKTQTVEDRRRNDRRAAEMAAAQAEADVEGNFWARFVIVTAVIFMGVGFGSLVVSMSNTPTGGGLVRGDGTRRNGKELAKH